MRRPCATEEAAIQALPCGEGVKKALIEVYRRRLRDALPGSELLTADLVGLRLDATRSLGCDLATHTGRAELLARLVFWFQGAEILNAEGRRL